MIPLWLDKQIIEKYPSSRENNSREIIRAKVELYQKTHHPKLGRELEQLLDVETTPERYHDDQAGDAIGTYRL